MFIKYSFFGHDVGYLKLKLVAEFMAEVIQWKLKILHDSSRQFQKDMIKLTYSHATLAFVFQISCQTGGKSCNGQM